MLTLEKYSFKIQEYNPGLEQKIHELATMIPTKLYSKINVYWFLEKNILQNSKGGSSFKNYSLKIHNF